MTTRPPVFVTPKYMEFVDTKQIAERLLSLTLKTGCDIIQKNGQRYYGPPQDWDRAIPEKGCEVFAGRLPRDCFEDELVPLFERVADIYQMRMMMNFSGFNRGFAFVTYGTPQEAWLAVSVLNNYEIRPGHKIGVSKSIDNCRLYIGGIPTEMCKNEAFDELKNIVSQTVKNIIMYVNPEDRSHNRGFLFAEFESHREAAMAKRQLGPGSVKFWDNDVVVDWADPEPDVDPEIMSQITKLFVRYSTNSISADYFRKLLYPVVPFQTIHRIFCSGHYAFIHFDTRRSAQIAKEHIAHTTVDNECLEVQWARPRCYKKQGVIKTNCRSVPPRLRSINNKFVDNSINVLPTEYGEQQQTDHVVVDNNFNNVNVPHNTMVRFHKLPPALPPVLPPAAVPGPLSVPQQMHFSFPPFYLPTIAPPPALPHFTTYM